LQGLKNKVDAKKSLMDRIFLDIITDEFQTQVLSSLPYPVKKERYDYNNRDFSFSGQWNGSTIEFYINGDGATVAFNEETDNDVIAEIPFSNFHKADAHGFYQAIIDCLTHIHRTEEEHLQAIESFRTESPSTKKHKEIIQKETT